MRSRKISIISNITVAPIAEVLEYVCRRESIPVEIELGEYDNIVQDAERFTRADVVCVFFEAANVIDGLQYRYETMTQAEQKSLDEKVRKEIDCVINSLRDTPLVIFNKFSALAFSAYNLRPSAFESFVERANIYLCERVLATKQVNILLVELDKILAKIGIDSALDYRYYHSSKALYTMAFYNCYANHILPAIMSLAGRSKKVLMLDCDNTLWFGVLGEDGNLGIEMTADTVKGSVFREVQHLF
jgi:predicted enzyme involved in methoxymalonyl-ACP biosynthesis